MALGRLFFHIPQHIEKGLEMKLRRLIIPILLSIFPLVVIGQSITENVRVQEAINLAETWIEAQRAYEQVPGISLAVVHNQDIVWRYAVGHSDLEKKTPTTTKTIQSICSISKLFTSIAIMQLRDKGLLRLDDPVSKHLKWFTIEQIYPQSPPITIRSLLTHSSGLPRESDYPYWNAPDFPFPSREEVVRQLESQKTLYPADKYYQYSNLGLTLAGEIVAEVSGENYNSYVNKNIIEPLGLVDTRPAMPEELYGTRLATGYSAKTREGIRNKLPLFQANAITPAAGFSSTTEDLAIFAAWQLRILESNNTEILKANTLREMHRVHWLEPNWKTARGIGFGIYRDDDVTFVGHQGSCPGYRSALMIQPKSKMAIICMANASGVPVGKYAQGVHRILSAVIQSANEDIDQSKSIDPALVKFTGTYSNDPWGGESAVVPWEGGLAIAYFPSDSPPTDLSKLQQIEDNLFSRLRDDGEKGEDILFVLDENGRATSMKQHSNYWKKVK